MTLQAATIKESFLKLTKTEQLELMQFFLQVFASPSSEKLNQPFVLSDIWKKELDRRDANFQNGKSSAVSLEEALAEFKL